METRPPYRVEPSVAAQDGAGVISTAQPGLDHYQADIAALRAALELDVPPRAVLLAALRQAEAVLAVNFPGDGSNRCQWCSADQWAAALRAIRECTGGSG